MSIDKFLIGFSCVLLISIGQILFKISSKSANFDSLLGVARSLMINYIFIASIITYFVATILWIKLLKSVDLRLAYPIMALAFLIVPLLSNIFLNERYSFSTLIGGLVILAGVVISFR